MSKTHRDRRHNYRTASGRCEVCGARLEAGDWHEQQQSAAPGLKRRCAHCQPRFETALKLSPPHED